MRKVIKVVLLVLCSILLIVTMGLYLSNPSRSVALKEGQKIVVSRGNIVTLRRDVEFGITHIVVEKKPFLVEGDAETFECYLPAWDVSKMEATPCYTEIDNQIIVPWLIGVNGREVINLDLLSTSVIENFSFDIEEDNLVSQPKTLFEGDKGDISYSVHQAGQRPIFDDIGTIQDVDNLGVVFLYSSFQSGQFDSEIVASCNIVGYELLSVGSIIPCSEKGLAVVFEGRSGSIISFELQLYAVEKLIP